MPEILVTTDSPGDDGATVLLRERVTLPDLESDHFAARLLERMGWALVECRRPRARERERIERFRGRRYRLALPS
jgi:hypothetical protein